ncbi:MAG: sodium/glutamate symporter, partial [Pyrinomonadaceae bacterium]
VRRFKLAPVRRRDEDSEANEELRAISPTIDTSMEREAARATVREKSQGEVSGAVSGTVLLHNLLLMLTVMGAGALVSAGIERTSFVLPGYIGAMVLAALVRNLDDRFGWFRVNARAVEMLGGIALALFLVIALMSLELWKLAELAVPMIIILSVQVVLMIAYAVFVTFMLMGRDYEAAVTASGHIGFGLGITPNAVANMEALTARYGPAPQSFLVVPVVGGFFIDFSNLLVITVFVNLVKKFLV